MTELQRLSTNRLRPLVAAALVACLVVGAAVPAAGLLADSPTTDAAAADTTGPTPTNAAAAAASTRAGGQDGGNASASAGAQLAGAIGSQQSEAAGELETRTLVVRLGRADSPEERAAVLAVLEARTDARLASLRERRERLRTAADNRSLSPGAYAYLAATVSVEASVTERLATRGQRATATLPASVTAEYGLSVGRFRALANASHSVEAALREDLRALGVTEVADEIDEGDDIDAEDLIEGLNETVAPGNRTNWPFDGNDSSLGDALDELDGENETIDVGDIAEDDGSDVPLDGNATDEDTTSDTGEDPLGGNLDGNVTDEDGLIDGTDDGLLGDNGTDGTADGTDEPTTDGGSTGDTTDGTLDGDGTLTDSDDTTETESDGLLDG